MFICELVITERCNLRCKYCYMTHEPLSLTHKSISRFKQSIEKILNFYGYHTKDLHVSYFGGEPLMEWELLKDFHEYVVSKIAKSSNIISNGLLLTEDHVRWIKDHKVGFSLSFDGLATDLTRPSIDGEKLLPKYLELKPLFRELGATSSKVMISPENVHIMYDNFLFFIDEWDTPFPDFSLVRDDIWDKASIETFEQQLKMIVNEMLKRYRTYKQIVSPGLITLYIADMFQAKRYGKRPFGCFAGAHGAAYYVDDIYYPCARFASAKRLPIYDAKQQKFVTDLTKLNLIKHLTNPKHYRQCKMCKHYTYCNAGCFYNELKEKDGQFYVELVESVCKLFDICYHYAKKVIANTDSHFIKTLLARYNITK